MVSLDPHDSTLRDGPGPASSPLTLLRRLTRIRALSSLPAGPEWLVLILSLLLCAFAYGGRLQSVDELAVYELGYNIAQRGALDVNLLASSATGMNAPPFSGIGEYGYGGNFYSGKGPLPSVLAIPLIRAGVGMPGGDPVAFALLLNIVLTACTAFLIARHLRVVYGNPRGGLVIGLLYMSGTMALAYSKRMFTEPSAALCIMLAYHLVVSSSCQSSRTTPGQISESNSKARSGDSVSLIVAGLAMGGAVAASYSNAALLPVFAGLLLTTGPTAAVSVRHARLGRRRTSLRSLALFTVGIVPCVAALALYNWVRFGDVTQTGLPLLAWSLPYLSLQAAMVRIYGLTLSPYRGLVWYCPILLAFPVAITRVIRAHEAESAVWERGWLTGYPACWIAPTATIFYLIFYGAWSMWWGGFNWGPRFLLPILPLWMICIAPAFTSTSAERRPSVSRRDGLLPIARRALLLALAGLSVAISLIGAVSDTFETEGILADQGRLGALVSPHSLSDSPLLTNPVYFQALSGLEHIVQGTWDVWWRPRPSGPDANVQRALADVEGRVTANSIVVVVAPARVELLLHDWRLTVPAIGLAPDRAPPDSLTQRILRQYSRVLLITDIRPADPNNAVEAWLETNTFRARNEFYPPWRVAAFGISHDQTTVSDTHIRFGDVLTMTRLEATNEASPGGALTIHVIWQDARDAALRQDSATAGIAWYAHLMAPDGRLISQHDALVGDAYGWGTHETIDDRRGVLVPLSAPPGVYRLEIGVYGQGGRRFTAISGGRHLASDAVSLDVQVR